ncbi:MAG: DUF2723 domain-containing protein [Bacteroidales bacterium]|nr:DUF2723 domain-containing protein [Bacteroidales bacterium]
MKKFKLYNNICGWVAFAIAAVTYLLTIEPTASFWDCGEFISAAYKLDVGHPPGAPFFMLTGRMFAHFASSPEMVARCINAMSALFSALTILFLFWTITHLARKIVFKDPQQPTIGQIIATLGAGMVGALAYTFSDTFWFSAVEGEVYAYSSLFTAVVFWAILKWEDCAEEPHSARWIVFIAYLMGLSIGVHLLNLLCIPALVLVYYYKKSPKASLKGSLLALLGSFALIAVILYGVVPGFVNMAGWADLLFVNVLGCRFNTGAIFYIVLVMAAMAWGLWETYRGNSDWRIRLAFCLNIILVGIPFFGYKTLVWVVLCAAVFVFAFKWKKLNASIVNLSLLCLTVMLIGYSSYGLTVIRSNAQPPMDQNSPDNMFTLERYLNREQYGETPLFYGQTFASQIKWKRQGNACIPQYQKRGPVWNKKAKASPDEKDRYIVSGYNERPVMAEELNMFFPRMYSSRADHIEAYKAWSGFKGKKVVYNHCGQNETVVMPTMADNLRFFFSYQINYMYWRYFMWNFSGRQNDIQGTMGEINAGNWITGIKFIDKALVGDLDSMPQELKNNKGYNRYYMLPLLLGLIGLLAQAYAGKKGIQGFWITFFLFFMTGLAIVLYLNQTPNQPRERDYAYAGSFYAFCIWIGLAVPALVKWLGKILPEHVAAILASVLCLGVPALMACENWDDHDRSGRYTCRDFAYNYLVGCEKDAIIFTNGDNDTFPLWYIQEVEGVRTDVRVCNMSYLQTDWYYNQMLRPYYESSAFPVSWPEVMYANGRRDIARIIPRSKDSIALQTAFAWLESDKDFTKKIQGYDENVDYIPARKLYLPVDRDQVLDNKYVDEKFTDRILPKMDFDLGGKSYLGKHELMLLKLLEEGKWTRPLYFAVTVDPELMSTYQNYFIHEGLIYKIAPVSRTIDTEKMFDNLCHQFRWGNIQDTTVYLDENITRMCRTQRQMFGILARALCNERKFNLAQQAIDRCFEIFPEDRFPINYVDGGMAGTLEIIEAYYKMGKPVQARAMLDKAMAVSCESLDWVFSHHPSKWSSGLRLVSNQLYAMQSTLSMVGNYDEEAYVKYGQPFQDYARKYQLIR